MTAVGEKASLASTIDATRLAKAYDEKDLLGKVRSMRDVTLSALNDVYIANCKQRDTKYEREIQVHQEAFDAAVRVAQAALDTATAAARAARDVDKSSYLFTKQRCVKEARECTKRQIRLLAGDIDADTAEAIEDLYQKSLRERKEVVDAEEERERKDHALRAKIRRLERERVVLRDEPAAVAPALCEDPALAPTLRRPAPAPVPVRKKRRTKRVDDDVEVKETKRIASDVSDTAADSPGGTAVDSLASDLSLLRAPGQPTTPSTPDLLATPAD